mmetsp:Transcript_18892/g.44398  ORF Transcript_18892/g.44398 Transcript_18892/m.44398 type:complete len:127 (-) Transcript_18892:76-456(-)
MWTWLELTASCTPLINAWPDRAVWSWSWPLDSLAARRCESIEEAEQKGRISRQSMVNVVAARRCESHEETELEGQLSRQTTLLAAEREGGEMSRQSTPLLASQGSRPALLACKLHSRMRLTPHTRS